VTLDPFLPTKIREELKRLQKEITFIRGTHSQDEAMALADLMVVMENGHIRQSAHPRDVFGAIRQPIDRTLHRRPQYFAAMRVRPRCGPIAAGFPVVNAMRVQRRRVYGPVLANRALQQLRRTLPI
jgi:ABC-type glutathione transport system ATPase component